MNRTSFFHSPVFLKFYINTPFTWSQQTPILVSSLLSLDPLVVDLQLLSSDGFLLKFNSSPECDGNNMCEEEQWEAKSKGEWEQEDQRNSGVDEEERVRLQRHHGVASWSNPWIPGEGCFHAAHQCYSSWTCRSWSVNFSSESNPASYMFFWAQLFTNYVFIFLFIEKKNLAWLI